MRTRGYDMYCYKNMTILFRKNRRNKIVNSTYSLGKVVKLLFFLKRLK